MRIEVKKLRHHPFNSKVYLLSDIDNLKESILSMGLLEPLIINKKNKVISGNRRLEALRGLDIEYVDVIVKDLKKDEEPIHIISHNQQRVKTCRELINEIKVLHEYYSNGRGRKRDVNIDSRFTTRRFIANEIGMSDGNVYKLLYVDEVFSELIDIIDSGGMTINQAFIESKRKKIQNSINEENKNNITKVHSEKFQIYNKSALNMSEISDQSIDMILTSPPYYSLRNYGTKDQLGLEPSIEEYLENMIEIFKECYRVLKKNGSCWVVIGDSYINGSLKSIPHKFAIKMMEQNWVQRNCIIWNKTNPKPESVKTRLCSSYEFIFFFTKSNKDYYFDVNSIREPYKSSKENGIKSPRHHNIKGSFQRHTPVIQNPLGKVPLDFFQSAKQSIGIGKKTGLKDLEHIAVYPKSICYLPIKSCSKQNETVLDPFCGSGTTGSVSLELKRNFIGYDINSKFVELTQRRLIKKLNSLG